MVSSNFDASTQLELGLRYPSPLCSETAYTMFKWALRHLIRRTNRHSIQKSYSKLLELPLEIFYLISDELPLYSRVLLSQTCRSMHSLLHDTTRQDMQSLSPQGYFEFLSGLSDTLPDYVTCRICNRLHKFDAEDTPSHPRGRGGYPCFGMGGYDHVFGIGYSLSVRHVQIALKHFRYRYQSANLATKLMQPFSTEVTSRDGSIDINFFAHPRVVDNRFLLCFTWEYIQIAQPASIQTIRPSAICPHLNLTKRSNVRLPPNPLSYTFASAFESPGQKFLGSCNRCLTDYSVIISSNKATVQVWKDFGSTGNPLDIGWQVHLWTHDNAEFYGPTIPHTPQDIMNAYNRESINSIP